MAREKAYGQDYQASMVDRLGVWLSMRRIHRHVRQFEGKRLGDFGCGYHATLSRTQLHEVEHALLADVALSDELKAHPKVTALEGLLPDIVTDLSDEALDFVLCINVLEHLWEPFVTLQHFYRMLAPDGLCLLNVPSWRGKKFYVKALKLAFAELQSLRYSDSV